MFKDPTAIADDITYGIPVPLYAEQVTIGTELAMILELFIVKTALDPAAMLAETVVIRVVVPFAVTAVVIEPVCVTARSIVVNTLSPLN